MTTDILGTEIEVGDIISSSSNTGNVKIGQVIALAKSGQIRVRIAVEVPIYAFERGAPDIPYESSRKKLDADGKPIEIGSNAGWGGRRYPEYEYETYTAYHKDYTKVGSRWKWKNEQASWTNNVIVRKHDGEGTEWTAHLQKLVDLDYSAPAPDMG